MKNKNTFRIGLCMAGAVSAGAYTAGVIDYLLESLEHWDRAKKLDLPDIPKHNVIIEVLTGASAGGMTAAITAGAVQDDFPHINKANATDPVTKQNPLYNAWVNMTETEGMDMMSQMLDDGDIINSESKEVKSIFNSTFIETLAANTIDNFRKNPDCKRDYIANNLEIITTLTNLRGLNYKIKFKTALGESEHRMLRHMDIAHFQLTETNTFNNDGKIPIHFNSSDEGNRDVLKQAAMATGAFPVGLAPRQVCRSQEYIYTQPYLNIGKDSIITHQDPKYICVTVDGGLIDNEPFGITDKILASRSMSQSNNTRPIEKSASKFDTTVIMIDPFPNYDTKTEDQYMPEEALKHTIPAILKSMRQQLMFKGEELENAYDEDNYTRFMVVPIRRDAKTGNSCDYPLACGGLSGFSGFFNKEFRMHDFLLGRRNAQRFIQRYFSVPANANNPIIENGYENIKDKFLIQGDNNENFLPIIPDIRITENKQTSLHEIKKPDLEEKIEFPSVKLSYIMSLEKKFEDRFDIVFKYILKDNTQKKEKEKNKVVEKIRRKGWVKRNVTGNLSSGVVDTVTYFARMKVKKLAAENFVNFIIEDLDKRKLLIDDVKK